jgi:hypothetical protein
METPIVEEDSCGGDEYFNNGNYEALITEFKPIAHWKDVIKKSRKKEFKSEIIEQFERLIKDVKKSDACNESIEPDEEADEDYESAKHLRKGDKKMIEALALTWAAAKAGTNFDINDEPDIEELNGENFAKVIKLKDHAIKKLKETKGLLPLSFRSYFRGNEDSVINALLKLKDDPHMSIKDFKSQISKYNNVREGIDQIAAIVANIVKWLGYIGFAATAVYMIGQTAMGAAIGSTVMDSAAIKYVMGTFMGPILRSLGAWLATLGGLSGGGWSEGIRDSLAKGWQNVQNAWESTRKRASEFASQMKALPSSIKDAITKRLEGMGWDFSKYPEITFEALKTMFKDAIKGFKNGCEKLMNLKNNSKGTKDEAAVSEEIERAFESASKGDDVYLNVAEKLLDESIASHDDSTNRATSVDVKDTAKNILAVFTQDLDDF